jgi:signal transduction histidine kinase
MPLEGRLAVEIMPTDGHITVAVADTGPGIPPALLERVFDPFFSTKERGSGLGLAICAGVAQSHHARLRAANRPTGGALFTVEFPVAPPASTAVSA